MKWRVTFILHTSPQVWTEKRWRESTPCRILDLMHDKRGRTLRSRVPFRAKVQVHLMCLWRWGPWWRWCPTRGSRCTESSSGWGSLQGRLMNGLESNWYVFKIVRSLFSFLITDCVAHWFRTMMWAVALMGSMEASSISPAKRAGLCLFPSQSAPPTAGSAAPPQEGGPPNPQTHF